MRDNRISGDLKTHGTRVRFREETLASSYYGLIEDCVDRKLLSVEASDALFVVLLKILVWLRARCLCDTILKPDWA